jgi:hypothetical protein
MSTPSRINASVVLQHDGRPRGFQLTLGSESVVLEPGRPWPQTDRFKWATRGLIEPPQSFAVHPDGSVDFNGETKSPGEPGSADALTEQLNKHHLPQPSPRHEPAHRQAAASTAHSPQTQGTHRVRFRVHFDSRSHVLIEATRNTERTETGLRGLDHLSVDGWMIRPASLHVDPLQRYVEIDGIRFEVSAEGVRSLEEALNQRYAPETAASGSAAIEIRENAGASTGFDIHFRMIRAGTRVDVTGHLSQDKLDILQDHDKCGLLRPGIILRISPPFLYLRRRRPDGGEEPIPEIPDIKYRAISAPELERLFNDPRIRAMTDDEAAAAAEKLKAGSSATPFGAPASAHPSAPSTAASSPLTPPPSVSISTPDASAGSSTFPATPHSPPPPPPPPSRPPAIEQPEDPVVAELFAVTDPQQVNLGVFRQLAERLHLAPQDVLLSLPRVFDDREFEILAFEPEEITSVLQLRGNRFYGFYLTHLGADRTDLVYACHGTHIEWSVHKCAIQPCAGSETVEFHGPALRGLAQNADNHFVFLVEPRFREFARHHEKACQAAFAHFLTVHEWAERRTEFPLLWPVAG